MEAPPFFVHQAKDGKDEEAFAMLAQTAERSVPPTGERIYSITFEHDGEEWTATVGEPLRGVKIPELPRNRSPVAPPPPPQYVSDPATVMAIFPGSPYVVVTDHGIVDDMRSRWSNPFLAGQPKRVVLFSDE